MNGYIVLANTIVFIHVLYVSVVVLSVPIILVGWIRQWSWVRNFWFRTLHLLMMTIVVVEAIFDWNCPLTTWERELRIAGNEIIVQKNDDGSDYINQLGERVIYYSKEYENDFVGRLLNYLIFFNPNKLNPNILQVCYYIFGTMILAAFILVPPCWPWRKLPTRATN